jgi:hypothetical protein
MEFAEAAKWKIYHRRKRKGNQMCHKTQLCPYCKKTANWKHLHDCAHGIEAMHMVGSERYVCQACGKSFYKTEGEKLGLEFVYD